MLRRFCTKDFHKKLNPKHLPRPTKESVFFSFLNNFLDSSNTHSVNKWKYVRKTILEHESNRGVCSNENIDSHILNYCVGSKKCALGFSYFDFLKNENVKHNLAIVSKYFKLFYISNEEKVFIRGKKLLPEDEEHIIKRYKDLRNEYPFLDSFTLESSIQALSLTSLWKKCLELMTEIKISATPNSECYCAVISAAFLNKEEELAWELLREMPLNNRAFKSIIFLTYINILNRLKNRDNIIDMLEKLLIFFQEYNVKCDQEVILNISDVAGKFDFKNTFTTVNYRGICKSCNKQLDKLELTNEQFEELKSTIFKNVILGKDVFVKTNPEELKRFNEFVKGIEGFDVVLDGLNIAYSAGVKQSPHALSEKVAAVVSHFVQKKKKVLVLGREHMNRWPIDNWGYVQQNSTVFLTQNISQDDPYLLYCALHSGRDTIIVTRDLMRGHRFLLKVPKLRLLFSRWLSQRQYQLIHIDNNGKPKFRIPPPFSIAAQQNGNIWHIPYVQEGQIDKNENKTWLCLRR